VQLLASSSFRQTRCGLSAAAPFAFSKTYRWMFAQRAPTGNIAMSESERLIRARIACLTEFLTKLDEYVQHAQAYRSAAAATSQAASSRHPAGNGEQP
jgi:hypothetical protein